MPLILQASLGLSAHGSRKPFQKEGTRASSLPSLAPPPAPRASPERPSLSVWGGSWRRSDSPTLSPATRILGGQARAQWVTESRECYSELCQGHGCSCWHPGTLHSFSPSSSACQETSAVGMENLSYLTQDRNYVALSILSASLLSSWKSLIGTRNWELLPSKPRWGGPAKKLFQRRAGHTLWNFPNESPGYLFGLEAPKKYISLSFRVYKEKHW